MQDLKTIVTRTLEEGYSVDDILNTLEAIIKEEEVKKAEAEKEKMQDMETIATLFNKYLKLPEPITAANIADSLELSNNMFAEFAKSFKDMAKALENNPLAFKVVSKNEDIEDPLTTFLKQHDLLS